MRRSSSHPALLSLICGAAVLAATGQPVRAESLNDVLITAYEHDPGLLAHRAAVRAVDEEYVRARAQFGPQVNANAQGGYDVSSIDQQDIFGNKVGLVSSAVTGSGSLVLNQKLYSGGHIAHQVDAALADVLAARENLRGFEIQTLHNVVQVYADLQTNIVLERLAQNHVADLIRLSDETTSRFANHEATRTDISQSNARLQQARIQLTVAQGKLREVRARFEAAVGRNPGELESVKELPGVPATVDKAFDIAERFNPQLLQAALTERASSAHVDEARTGDAASVSLQVGVSAGPITPYEAGYYGRSFQALVVVNKPIFSGGITASRVRESLATNSRDKLNIDAVRRDVVLAVSQSWSELETARRVEDEQRVQVQTQREAAIGIEKERSIGLRTLTDVLNSSEEIEAAEISAAKSHGDVLLAEADVLATIGFLDLHHLAPGGASYDPATSFRKVSGKAGGPLAGVLESIDRIGSAPTTYTPPTLRGRMDGDAAVHP